MAFKQHAFIRLPFGAVRTLILFSQSTWLQMFIFFAIKTNLYSHLAANRQQVKGSFVHVEAIWCRKILTIL